MNEAKSHRNNHMIATMALNYSLLNRIFQRTDGGDGNFYSVSRMNVAGRFEAGADT